MNTVPIRLITLNACLFPVGLRHCWNDCNKDNRLTALQQLVLLTTNKQILQNNNNNIQEHDDWFNNDIICLQEVFSSVWCDKWKQSLLKLVNLLNPNLLYI